MKRFENRTLDKEQCLGRHRLNKLPDPVTIKDLEFVKCKFVGCALVTYGSSAKRSTARNIRITDCAVNSYYGSGAVFDDIIVDGLRTSVAPINLPACAFRHVVLKGHVGAILMS